MIAPKIQLPEEKIFVRMATLCAKRESCKSEIRKKLDRYDLREDAKKRIITRLEKENYLNERRYCRSFIHDKHQFNKWTNENRICIEAKANSFGSNCFGFFRISRFVVWRTAFGIAAAKIENDTITKRFRKTYQVNSICFRKRLHNG